jgi:hypothetical protein
MFKKRVTLRVLQPLGEIPTPLEYWVTRLRG